MIVSNQEVPIFQKQFDSLTRNSSLNNSKSDQYQKFIKDQTSNPFGMVIQGPQMFDLIINASMDKVDMQQW